MATKRCRPVVDYLVYLAVRTLVCVVQALPIRLALGLANPLSGLIHALDRRHREVAAENLRHAFPEKSTCEIERLVRECYRHFCLLLIEIILLPRKFRMSNWRRHGELINGEPISKVLISERPCLLVTAHLGNWELAGFALGAIGHRTYAIARVLDNPYLERFLKRFRQATGQTIIAKKDDFDRLESVLKSGGKVATLADQDAGQRGVFVNFFGRSASAHKAVALMALEFSARMIVAGTVRTTNLISDRIGPYEMICEDVIDPEEYRDRPDAIREITQRYHDALERLIRKHPEQYFWLHRRWKSQPVKRQSVRKVA